MVCVALFERSSAAVLNFLSGLQCLLGKVRMLPCTPHHRHGAYSDHTPSLYEHITTNFPCEYRRGKLANFPFPIPCYLAAETLPDLASGSNQGRWKGKRGARRALCAMRRYVLWARHMAMRVAPPAEALTPRFQ